MTSSGPRTPGGRPLPARLDPRRGGRTPDGPSGRGQRAALAARLISAVAAVAVLAGSGWGWYLGRVADANVTRTAALPAEGNEDVTGDGAALNLLLVGNDSRASASDEELAQLNTTANDGINTDTMILVHVPADGSQASFVSFPRDSWVEIPGYDWDKLNAAYAYGYQFEAGDGATEEQRRAAGAQLLIQTVSGLSGVQVDHYAEVDLLGFFKLSEVVGGVEVNLCAPAKDSFSGVDLPAGPQTISGEQALAFVRQRHGVPGEDFGRIVRQQTYIGAMVRKLLSDDVLFDLGKQRRLVEAAAESLTVDESLKLLDLAAQMQSVTADSVRFQTVPNLGPDREGSKSIVRLEDEDVLHRFFAELSAEPEQEDAPPAAAPEDVDPADVPVAVFNGSGIAGLAAEAAAGLEEQGYPVTGTGNADSSDYTRTEVRHAAGDEGLAATLAATIPGATISEVDDVEAGTVQLVLGSDFSGIGEPLEAPPAQAPTATETPRTAADTTCIN
ncbi:LCP family protein [Candidatus Blastococcus massiliensis]|uniref:LCP family protein n=1 Tax=Candidatus Blastococcus massiliensis TaxID=1470358 RepID=UPI0004B32A83|nr:LCP family protein [Candidatus Blastococcus massiliensis]